MSSALRLIGSKLARQEDLSDTDFYAFLAELDCSTAGGAPDTHTSSAAPGPSPTLSPADGGMRLARREAEIRASEDRCQPASTLLLEGGTCTISLQSGPPQSFSIGRDVEEAFVTPAIPAGSSYSWAPPEPGRYIVSSEIYPHLRCAVKVVGQQEASAAPGSSAISSSRNSLAGEHSSSSIGDITRSRNGSMSADVEEFIRFPLLGTRPGLPSAATAAKATSGGTTDEPASRSNQGTQTSSSRQTTTTGAGLVLGRFSLPTDSRPSSGSSAAAASADEDAAAASKSDSLLDSPPVSGLRRRGRWSAPAAEVPAVGSLATVLPERPAMESFSALSNGSTGSPRCSSSSGSGSGSERSSTSAPLYVQRRMPGGMLSTTHAYSMGTHSGSGGYSDSRSSGEEMQPLLYSVGRPRQPHLQPASYGSSYAYSQEPSVGGGASQDGEPKAPTFHKCPRCRKEYVSTINQRRCISSHLGSSGTRSAAHSSSGAMPDSKQLTEFWDGLGEAEKREVMDVSSEPNSEHIVRQLEAQLLHRKRDGQLEGLSKEQRRLHTAGKMLHQFCTGVAGPGGSAFTGSNLASVLSQVSEGTFLCSSNTINRAEFAAGDNLEAGLGALVTKRLVEAHLRAKQCDAERLQRELEDLETAQAPQKGKQQPQKNAKSKAKGKAAPVAKPIAAIKSAAAAATAAGASESSSDADSSEEAAAAAAPAVAEAVQQANGEAAWVRAQSPPAPGGRYGSSPQRPSAATGSFTNFLFAAEEAAEDEEEEEDDAAAEVANGWQTASSSRPSSRASRGDAPPKANCSMQAAAPCDAKCIGSSSARLALSSTGGIASGAERSQPKATAERCGSTNAPAASPKAAITGAQRRPAAAAVAAAGPQSNGKMATGAAVAHQPTAPAAGGKQPPSQQDSFPALPPGAGSKSSTFALAANGAAPAFSYAAAAAKTQHKEPSKAATVKPGATPAPKQREKQSAPVPSSLAPQPNASLVPAASAKPKSDSAGAALPPSDAAAVIAEPARRAAAQEQQPATSTVATAAAAPQPEPTRAGASAPATEQPTAVPETAPLIGAAAPVAAAAEMALEVAEGATETQRPASVTPPISDAGSPPPSALLHPPPDSFLVPPPVWVGPDNCMMPPLPMGYYWHGPIMPPLGMQFGSMEMQEVVPHGPYPPLHPAFYHPPPYLLPPSHPGTAPGMPMHASGVPPPHHMGFGDGLLAPFPPGMPVPLPPEAAEELAAAALAHVVGQQQAAGEWLGDSPAAAGKEPQQQEERSEEAIQLAAALEDSAGPKPARQPPVQQPAKRSFLALLEAACGSPPVQQAPAAVRGFDAAAAAAEFERRWQAAAPKLVKPQLNTAVAPKAVLAAPPKKHGAGGLAALKVGAKAARSSSPCSLAVAKGSAWGSKAGLAGGSGRNSPAGGGTGVVVAVRVLSSDENPGDGRWQIHTAKQQRLAAVGDQSFQKQQ